MWAHPIIDELGVAQLGRRGVDHHGKQEKRRDEIGRVAVPPHHTFEDVVIGEEVVNRPRALMQLLRQLIGIFNLDRRQRPEVSTA